MADDINTGKAGTIPKGYKVLIILIVIVTILAVWLLPDNEQTAPPALPELPGTQKAMDLPQPAGGSGTVMRDGDRARAFVEKLRNSNEEFDPNAVFSEAEKLTSEGYVVDAHLLYRFAARHGNGQAAFLLGTQADPAYSDTASPAALKDNPEQAYKWYSLAAASGIDEAVVRLQALRQNLEMSASGGDERAQRILLLWK